MLSISSAGAFAAGLLLPFVAASVGRRQASELAGAQPVDGASLEVVIPAYLEATVIGESLERLRDQLKHWPGESRITVVASDEETAKASKTADKVLEVGRHGKPAAVNAALEASGSDVIVLTDANCEISPNDWPRLLLRDLSECRLVSGNKTEMVGPEGAFWKYEATVKRATHGSIGTLAVVGEFLAFRRLDFRPIPRATQLDDLWLAMDFNRRGLRVGVSPDISTIEEAAPPREQWERRTRIAAGQMMEVVPRILELSRTAVGRLYLAHKLYRTTAGALAFWLSAISFVLIRPKLIAPIVVPLMSWAIAHYRGVMPAPRATQPVCSAIAMQAVPIAGFIRVVKRMRQGRKGELNTGWTKIPR
ncbi:glycosyltransferase [Arthrobacter crystallopoietes]|uniref:glycosyltransferase n=1 Tax=Crystallibacter crystallopoietes TaxID=37928 RepID=UPI003D1DB9BA